MKGTVYKVLVNYGKQYRKVGITMNPKSAEDIACRAALDDTAIGVKVVVIDDVGTTNVLIYKEV